MQRRQMSGCGSRALRLVGVACGRMPSSDMLEMRVRRECEMCTGAVRYAGEELAETVSVYQPKRIRTKSGILLGKHNTPAQASRTATDCAAQYIHTEGAPATPKETYESLTTADIHCRVGYK